MEKDNALYLSDWKFMRIYHGDDFVLKIRNYICGLRSCLNVGNKKVYCGFEVVTTQGPGIMCFAGRF